MQGPLSMPNRMGYSMNQSFHPTNHNPKERTESQSNWMASRFKDMDHQLQYEACDPHAMQGKTTPICLKRFHFIHYYTCTLHMVIYLTELRKPTISW